MSSAARATHALPTAPPAHTRHHLPGATPLTAPKGGPPQVSADMSLALRRTGIQLRESFVWGSPAHSSASKRIVTVAPGLARLCSHRLWMEEIFATLGRSNLVFLLQSREDRAFDACLRTIRLIADNSTSSVVVGRMWLATRPGGLPCNRTSASSETRGTFPRVQMQTFAAGRAYEWALHFFPRSEYVARVRLDASSCLPSDAEMGRLPVDRPVLVTNDFDVSSVEGESRTYFTSDRYAFVPVALAASYFEAWRVWSRVRCDHPCLAGLHGELAAGRWRGAGNGQCGANVTANVLNGCGECPLTAWLSTSKARHSLARAPATGEPIARQRNRTHAVLQGSEADAVPIASVAALFREMRRRSATCIELPQRQKGRGATGRAGSQLPEPSKAGPHPPTTRPPHKDAPGARDPAHKGALGAAPKAPARNPAHKDAPAPKAPARSSAHKGALGAAPRAPRATPQTAPKGVPQAATRVSAEGTKPWACRPGIVDYVCRLLGYPPGRGGGGADPDPGQEEGRGVHGQEGR